MYEKITRKNSTIYNQLWINKIIEERHMELLPSRRISNLSIGEYIESIYLARFRDDNDNPIKISKSNSILFEQEWKEKFREEKLSLPAVSQSSKISLAEMMEIKYNEEQTTKVARIRKIEKCIQLNDK